MKTSLQDTLATCLKISLCAQQPTYKLKEAQLRHLGSEIARAEPEVCHGQQPATFEPAGQEPFVLLWLGPSERESGVAFGGRARSSGNKRRDGRRADLDFSIGDAS
jgi:hypothetical protein